MTFREQLKASKPDEYPDTFVDYMLSGLVYVAGPYMHEDPAIREERFNKLTEFTGELMKDNVHAFSPITHNHPIAVRIDLPKDWNFWRIYDLAMLSLCRAMIVMRLPGWEKSVGVNAEIEFARKKGIMVFFTERFE